jgi:HD-GYP domain-containing protein (c-di-GMP phosphodiesterase class II)
MSDGVCSTRSARADQSLVLGLAAVLRTARYFDSANAVMQQVSATLADEITQRIAREGSLRIGTHSHCLFVGPARVPTTPSTYERFTSLIEAFDSRDINAVTFFPGMTGNELSTLALVLAQTDVSGPDEINTLLLRKGVRRIEVDYLAGGSNVQAVAPVEAYAAAAQLGEKLREITEGARQVDVRQVRRVTQVIVDQILDDPVHLLALTTIKELNDRLISHSANVAILSVLLGQTLRLSKTRLGELCLAAYLHDAGKLETTREVLDKPGPLDPQEWVEMRKHPLVAARGLLASRQLTPSVMRAVVVAYEHHLNFDMSGYPVSQFRDHVTLFGNIVAIADRYDALTTARRYRRFSFTPHEVLGYLLYYAGKSFDPMLVKLFVVMMGIFPPGTLVRLTDGETAVVCQPPLAGQPLDRPKVRVWSGPRAGTVIDLAEQTGESSCLDVEMVLCPAGMGVVPAMDLSLFEVADNTDAESCDEDSDTIPEFVSRVLAGENA